MANIHIKLEYWKNRLLDLGKRNKLINCPLPKSVGRVSRTSLLLSNPSIDELWSFLDSGNKSLEFPIPLTNELISFEDMNDETSSVFNNGIKTNQTQNEAYKTLRSLMKKAKEFTEEKGVNALYLAFGFLIWKENGTDGQEMRSPLVLLPVKLKQEDLFSPILLSRAEDEVTTNYSLEQKLLRDFGIKLPSLTEETELREYLIEVQQAISSLEWNISTDVIQLSLFSFMKINMYRDLEQNSDKITSHQIVRALNGEMFNDATDISYVLDYNHDITEPQSVFSVVDADSSQQDAILLAKRGTSFVLQGPPGTGKSQTITNIIAELIADGKKVLFVSEKMAALEVVHKRLVTAGLGDFCLTLHSHNAKRRDILDQFEKSMKLSRQKTSLQQEAFNKLYRLKEIRESLNAYSKELHTVVEPLGKTIFQVNGYISQLENYKNIDYIQTNAEKFTPELLAECESVLEELERIVRINGYQQNNPWRGCVLTQWTHEFKQQFMVDAEKLTILLNYGIALFNEVNKILGSENNWAYNGVDEVTCILAITEKSPNVPSDWISIDLQKTRDKIVECQTILSKKMVAAEQLSRAQLICNGICKKLEYNVKIDDDFSNTSILYETVNEYNEQLSLKDILTKNKSENEICQKDLSEKIIITEKSYAEGMQKYDSALCQWETARAELLAYYDTEILNLDLTQMMILYRTTYRSWFHRLSNGYRQNKKTLLSFCKTTEKLKYKDSLILIDKIANVQTLKGSYEASKLVKENAEKLLDTYRQQLETTKEDSTSLNGEIETNIIVIKQTKEIVLSATQNLTSELKHTLDSTAAKFTQLCDELNNKLCLTVNDKFDFSDLIERIDWSDSFYKVVMKYNFSLGFIKAVCECSAEVIDQLSAVVLKLQEWKENVTHDLDKFALLFGENNKELFYTTDLTKVVDKSQSCNDNFASLQYLIDYHNIEKKIAKLGIDTYLRKAKELNLTADEVVAVFKKCFFRSWLDALVPNFPAINEFRRLRQDERITLFHELDKSHLEISKAMLLSKLMSHLPNFDAFSSSGEIALLRREMAKQRKLMPTRLLIANLPNLLPAVKPCVMMSPLSVSTYLGNTNFEFDTVIFDEASQVRTEDAIGAIFRAKQTIIAGDSKQLPPTDFFNSSMAANDEFEEDEEGESDDTGAYESLLDEATMLPTQTLLWHYRSRHEHLIAFSNKKIYNGNLITFPSSVEKSDSLGVEYIYVKDGIYDRGGKNGNKAEAAKVAELVFEHFLKYTNRSLGIIAFSEVQQSAIQDAIIAKRQANPTFETFFKEDKEESLFIKNLETVQGDERDTIIFSIGYAPDLAGKFIMNFGPLTKNGGERRLNVAVTRARYNLKLVGSILPTDIDISKTKSQGVKLLRLYIDFAINGVNAILSETSVDEKLWFDSPFETSVYDFLISNGFDVVTQVGCSGYRIDMAVRHPKYNGRFAVGIECDGAMYHSARTARERDRLRQTVLENMGWKIYRIWSTDWIKDRHTEGALLLSIVKQAIEEYRENVPQLEQTPLSEKNDNFLNVSTQSIDEVISEGIHEKFSAIRSSRYGYQAKDVPVSDVAKTMLKVLSTGFGLDKVGLFKETALYGYGWQRQGATIQQKFELAFIRLLQEGVIIEEDGKIKMK